MEFTFEAIGTNTFLAYTADIGIYDEFSLKMLENNNIEGILPFSSIHENRKKKIRYAITSYETLEDYIRRPLPLTKILNIFESIASAAIELEEYMLCLNGIVLETSYMYVDIGTGITRLIYLPLKEMETVDVFGFLRGLLGRVQYEMPESAVCILQISNDINSGNITGLKQLLDAVRQAGTADRKRKSEPERDNTQTILQQRTLPEETEYSGERVSVPAAPVAQQISRKETGVKQNRLLGSGEKKTKEPKSKKKKENVKPVQPGFAIPGAQQQAPVPVAVPSTADMQEETDTPGRKKSFFGFKKKEKSGPVPLENRVSQEHAPGQPAEPEKAEVKLDFGKTVISQPDDEVTVVAGMGEEVKQGISYIVRRKNGQKMYLEQDITKIGRESSYVDFYIGDNLEIGRSHADILRIGQSYYIKDNHSKNHTYVNDRMIVGDEPVRLNPGDIIALSNEMFEYHED